MNDSQNIPDPCIEALKRIVCRSKGKATGEPTRPVAELALWRVPSTREAIVRKGEFSTEEIDRLDELAAANADTASENIAEQSAHQFQPGVRLEEPDCENRKKPDESK